MPTLYQYVVEAGVRVSTECCSNILHIGRRCNDLFVEATISYKHLSEKEAEQAVRKNDKQWNFCKTVGQMHK